MEVRIQAYVYAYYESNPPIYRIWVNDNLHTEREFWVDPTELVIVEQIIIDVEPGEHTLTIEKVQPRHGSWVWIERTVVTAGDNGYDSKYEIKKQNKQVINFKIVEPA